MERREELLRAAARVYAKHGYRGSTTRRIADEARVNEVTIFRQFGSKDALIHEAISNCGGEPMVPDLPTVPVDPSAELLAWTRATLQNMSAMQAMMRRCMSELEEHPQLSAPTRSGSMRTAGVLCAYLLRLREHGFAEDDFDVKAASAMLIGVLFADAMGRRSTPNIFPSPLPVATEAYTKLLLRAIGVHVTSSVTSSVPEHSSLA